MSHWASEKPLVWLSNWRGGTATVCSGCLGIITGTGRKCVRCRMVAYCGRGCQGLDWSQGGHRRECAFFPKLASKTAQALLTNPRLRLVARLYARLYANYQSTSDKNKDLDSKCPKPPEEAIEEEMEEKLKVVGEEDGDRVGEEMNEDGGAAKEGAGVGEDTERFKDPKVAALVEALQDAGDWWGPGGCWAEDEGDDWAAMLEASWEVFCSIYLHNSSFYRAVVKRAEFERLLGKVCAGTLTVIQLKELVYQETGHAIYTLPNGLPHRCDQPHLRYTTEGRSLRLIFTSEAKAAEARRLIADGRRSEVYLSRLPALRSPEHMRPTERDAAKLAIVRRCDCDLCAGNEQRLCEWALSQACPDCSQALYYDPDRAGAKVAVCLRCDAAKASLPPDLVAQIRSSVARLRRSMEALDARSLLASILELRTEAAPYLSPDANLLRIQTDVLAFHHLYPMASQAFEEGQTGLLGAITAFGAGLWRRLEATSSVASVDVAVLAALLYHAHGKRGEELLAHQWLRRAHDTWHRIDAEHPTALSFKRRLEGSSQLTQALPASPQSSPIPKEPKKDPKPEAKKDSEKDSANATVKNPTEVEAKKILGELMEDEHIQIQNIHYDQSFTIGATD